MTHPVYADDCQKFEVLKGSAAYKDIMANGVEDNFRLGNEAAEFPVQASADHINVVMPDCEVIADDGRLCIMIPTEASFPGADPYNSLKRVTVRTWVKPAWLTLVPEAEDVPETLAKAEGDEDLPF